MRLVANDLTILEVVVSRTYEFLNECGTFYLATINENKPAVRPFGAIMELEGELYFSTANTKDVYSQLKKNQLIQIIALKTGTRDWIRIDGKAVEEYDSNIKQEMLNNFPVLLRRFDTKNCEYFALFKIVEMMSQLYTNDGVINLT